MEPPTQALIIAILGLGSALFAIWFVLKLSGWSELSAAYPCRNEVPRPRFLGSAVFKGWVGYNNGLLYAVDQSGLYVKAIPILLWGHPSIHIPWSEIEAVEERRRWYGSDYRILTRAARDVDFAVRGWAWPKIRPAFEAAGVRIAAQKS